MGDRTQGIAGKNISGHLTRSLSEHPFIGSKLASFISGRVAKHAIRKFWAYQYRNGWKFPSRMLCETIVGKYLRHTR
jgi:hypothetical protein